MTELDKQLKEIDIWIGDDGFGEDCFRELSEDELAQIHKVYKDTGWVSPTTTYELADQYLKGRDASHNPDSPYMTGQEFYDRFEKALTAHGMIDTEDADDNVVLAESVATVYLNAAKKAAGIE